MVEVRRRGRGPVEEIQRPTPIVGVERQCAKYSIWIEWEGNGGGAGGEVTAELGRETAKKHQRTSEGVLFASVK